MGLGRFGTAVTSPHVPSSKPAGYSGESKNPNGKTLILAAAIYGMEFDRTIENLSGILQMEAVAAHLRGCDRHAPSQSNEQPGRPVILKRTWVGLLAWPDPAAARTNSAFVFALLISLTGCKENAKSTGGTSPGDDTVNMHHGPPLGLRESNTRPVSKSSEKDLRGYLEEYGQHPLPVYEERKRFLKAILGLAEINPTDALDYLRKLGEIDPAAAEDGFFEVSKMLAENDPKFFADWLLTEWPKMKDGEVKNAYLSSAMTSLGWAAPSVGLDLIGRISFPPSKKSYLLDNFFSAFSATDPNGAFAAAQLLDPSSRDAALSSIVRSAATYSPKFALQVVDQIDDQKLQGRAMAEAFRCWFSQTPDEAATAFQALDPGRQAKLLGVGSSFEGGLLSVWARKQPDALFKLLGSLEPSIRNREVFESSVYFTVTDHTEETFALIAALPDSELKSTMIDNAYRQLCETNLAAAVECLNGTDDTSQRNLALKSIGAKIGSLGMPQTLESMEHLPLEEKKLLFENAWRGLTISDFPGLLSYLGNGFDSLQLGPAERGEIISNAAEGVAIRNQDQAVNWLNSAEGQDRMAVMKGLARSMANDDPEKLGAFLNSIPHDEAWSAGVGTMIRVTEAVNGKKAEPWKAALREYERSKVTPDSTTP